MQHWFCSSTCLYFLCMILKSQIIIMRIVTIHNLSVLTVVFHLGCFLWISVGIVIFTNVHSWFCFLSVIFQWLLLPRPPQGLEKHLAPCWHPGTLPHLRLPLPASWKPTKCQATALGPDPSHPWSPWKSSEKPRALSCHIAWISDPLGRGPRGCTGHTVSPCPL